MTEDQMRFSEIIENIDELMEEAINLLPENIVGKAKSYWYAHILCAINDDHEFLGGSMHHMQNSLDEWIEQDEVEEDSDNLILSWMSQEDEDDYIANNPLPNEGPINDEDWDMDAGRPASMRDEDWN